MKNQFLKIFLLGCFLVCSTIVYSQVSDIDEIEYFVDVDPGYGNGMNFSFTVSDTVLIDDLISTSSLSIGVHYLYSRAKNQDDVWGMATPQAFVVSNPTQQQTSISDIQTLEYFVDTDPGYGNGANLSLAIGDTINVNDIIPTLGLAPGVHYLYARVKNLNGTWGLASEQSFFVGLETTQTEVLSPITTLEYFIDTDPGYGNGVNLSLTVGDTINVNDLIPTTGIAPGVHYLYTRVKNLNNSWGLALEQSFYVSLETEQTDILTPITTLEYFIDEDPGYGNGANLVLAVGDTINITDIVPTLDVLPGVHFLYTRVKNADNSWGLATHQSFYVSPETVQNSNVSPLVSIEYFVDTDPGYGNGTLITIPATDTLNLNTMASTLALCHGTHQIYVRALDESGDWGFTETSQFYLGNCEGDANFDGVVNVIDLISVSSAFGCTVSCVIGDANFDGVINILDLLSVSSNFAYVCDCFN